MVRISDLLLREVQDRREDPEDPRPFSEFRLTPLYGLRVVSPEEIGGTFEIDKEAVYQFIRDEISEAVGKELLSELRREGIDYQDMAVKSPSKTLEYHNSFMKGVLSEGVFDRVSDVLRNCTLLEKTEVYQTHH